MTFEAYQTYQDLLNDGGRFIQTPEVLADNVKKILQRLMPSPDDKWISSVEDLSDEKRGIKFEIKLSTGDVIHAFKLEKEFGKWEFYLNRRKKSDTEIRKHFIENTFSPLERWELVYKNFDSNYYYSDDSKRYKSGLAQEKILLDLYKNLSANDKKKAYKVYTLMNSKNPDMKTFGAFLGI